MASRMTFACSELSPPRSSVEYLNEEDKARPKSQSYKVFVDMPIAIATSPA